MFPLTENDYGVKMTSVKTVFVALDLILVGLRFWSRHLKRTKSDVSDAFIVLAWAIAFADMVRCWVATREGAGMHTADIMRQDPTALTRLLKLDYVGYWLWAYAVTFTKISIALLYRAIFFCNTRFVYLCHGVIGFNVLVVIGYSIALLAMCRPISFIWDPFLKGGYCGFSLYNIFVFSGSINLALDIFLVAMPIPMVWKLQMNLKKKIGISMMFCLGVLVCVFVGLRFRFMNTNENDYTYTGEIGGILIAFELYLGIISACLPLLSPALFQIYQHTHTWSLVRLLSHTGTSSDQGSFRWTRDNGTMRNIISRSLDRQGSGSEEKRSSDEGQRPLKLYPGHEIHDVDVRVEALVTNGSGDQSDDSRIHVTRQWKVARPNECSK